MFFFGNKFNDSYLDPPDDSENAILKCENCKEYIYNDDLYFIINGTRYCEDCLESKFISYEDLKCENCDSCQEDFYYVIDDVPYCEDCAKFEFGRIASFEDLE